MSRSRGRASPSLRSGPVGDMKSLPPELTRKQLDDRSVLTHARSDPLVVIRTETDERFPPR
jgi:hypothetical protein